MMKLNFLFLFTVLTISYSQAQNIKSEAKNAVRSQGSMKDIAALDEGYTEFEGGLYALKDYLVRGKVNLVRVTYGSQVSNPNYNNWLNKPKYYVQKAEDYREIFLTNQNPSATSTLLLGGATTRQSLNNRKFTSSMLTSSTTTLKELMGDNAEVLTKINNLKKITESNIRKLVKIYNQ
ncbi:MAG: hypothetical protein ACO1N7_01125 [Sphingobacteriaceae bacterium]